LELYLFFHGALAWIATVAILWPINIPMLALAYRIHNIPEQYAIEPEELWWPRATGGAFCIAILTVAAVALDYVMVDWGEVPAGPAHLVVFMAWVPAATWILFIWFAYTDVFEGLSLLIIYLGIPIFVLIVLNAIFGFWNFLLAMAYQLLKAPT
jgi:hypothetical protein